MTAALLETVIEHLRNGVGEDCIRQAGDLLTRHQVPSYQTGDVDVDAVVLTSEEALRLREVLRAAIRCEPNLGRAGRLAWALSKMAGHETDDVLRELLLRSLRQLLEANATMFQCEIALNNARLLDPDGRPTSMLDLDRNVALARAYLQRFNVVVPW